MADDKPFYCNATCRVQWIFATPNMMSGDRQMVYMSCLVCRKKVIDDGNSFRCENCQQARSEARPVFNF